ncbi:glycoside hydrolase family 78 protein [Sporosarcina sp. FSL W7-1283]|uniref:glycoside hydrolase family 78 protein n=1 Tax=Sporosarcina sp. FSL W7-1283 TaxID=2921560 RepID=UPI0030F91178
MATGDLIKLGTLYLGGTKRSRPTNPVSGGDVHAFSAGQTIEIRNTESSEADKLHWREINDGGKKYLVADRALIRSISWDDLNAQSLIFGKEITIDGQQYKIRSLTGGSTYRSGTDAYSGGSPSNNEWDRWIVNEANISGLPKPTATDLTNNSANLNGAHNQFWNWYNMYSWAQETYTGNSSDRAFRGYYSARFWDYSTSSYRGTYFGFRPVLEVLNSAPLISGDTQNQGNKTAPFSVQYQVSDPEGDAVSIVEKLNGTVIKTETNITQGVNRKITLTNEQWVAIPLNQESTITIEATDAKGAKSTRVFTFTKTNAAPTATAVEPRGDLSNIGIVDTQTPIFVWSFNDPDAGDRQSAYQFIIEDTNNNLIHDSGKKTSTQSFYQLPEANKLAWGTRYKWKVKVWDRFDIPSEDSFPEFIMPNRPPNVSNVLPGSNDKENPAGAGLNPEVAWDFEDLDLEAQAAYQVKIYKSEDDALVYDSSRIGQNVHKHQVPAGRLSQGVAYYTVVTVWDPNGLKTDSEPSYFRTNATPSAPILTGPVDNYRTTLKPTLIGIVGTDPEDDGMHFRIQISTDPTFVQYAFEKSSEKDRAGWQVNGYDIPEVGVKNDQQGQSVAYTMQVDLDYGKTYYWRMASVDAGTGARGVWSSVRRVRAGNELIFEIKNPVNTANTAARRILFAADYQLPTDGTTKATLKVEFANNALDVSPTWEDATDAFLSMDYHDFANDAKTAGAFAIGVRMTIKANDSMAPIGIEAIGLTFD